MYAIIMAESMHGNKIIYRYNYKIEDRVISQNYERSQSKLEVSVVIKQVMANDEIGQNNS